MEPTRSLLSHASCPDLRRLCLLPERSGLLPSILRPLCFAFRFHFL
jgi:hypothetical protein